MLEDAHAQAEDGFCVSANSLTSLLGEIEDRLLCRRPS